LINWKPVRADPDRVGLSLIWMAYFIGLIETSGHSPNIGHCIIDLVELPA
jgi:hypothetical protein